MISQLIIRKEPFLIKQRWAILHSRSVHLLTCLWVKKQQGIGLYNELQRGFSFSLRNLFLTNELASSSLHRRAKERETQREPPAPISCPCVFYKATTVINEVQYLLLSRQADTAEYSSGLF